VSEKMVSLAAKRCRSPGSTGRISGPLACLTGEFANLRTMNAAFDRMRGGAGECARQNRPRPATDVRTAPRLHNECASFRIGARNFVNDRQGYQTVKTASRLVENLDPRIARPIAFDQCEQRRGMRRVQPDAAMQRGAAEPRSIVGAVNGGEA
jgi:hypothetical protein